MRAEYTKDDLENAFLAGRNIGYTFEEFLTELSFKVEDTPVLVGHLKKRYGLNGFIVAEIGHEVYEFEDRYQFILQSVKDGGEPYTVKFYKDTFRHCIDFL